MITALISVRGFPGGYDYRSVEVNGTEFTSVAVPLINMAAGLQNIIIQVLVGVIIEFLFHSFTVCHHLQPFRFTMQHELVSAASEKHLQLWCSQSTLNNGYCTTTAKG